MTCPYCGCATHNKKESVPSVEIRFLDNCDNIAVANAKRINDAFYEIVDGKHKGNLVHTFDILQ